MTSVMKEVAWSPGSPGSVGHLCEGERGGQETGAHTRSLRSCAKEQGKKKKNKRGSSGAGSGQRAAGSGRRAATGKSSRSARSTGARRSRTSTRRSAKSHIGPGNGEDKGVYTSMRGLLSEAFDDFDEDGSGTLTIDEFRESLRNPDVVNKLKLIDLPVSDAQELFMVW